MPSDIKDAVYQDQVATSLLSERDQADLSGESHEQNYSQPDSGQDEYYPSPELQQARDEFAVEQLDQDGFLQEEEDAGEPGTDLFAEVTPEAQQAHQQQWQQFESLPQEQQASLASQALEQDYTAVAQSLDPQTASRVTEQLGQVFDAPDLANHVNPLAFASFAEVWSNNLETTIKYHPEGPRFVEALAQGNVERAQQALARMSSPMMCQAFLNDLGMAINRPDAVAGFDPMEAALHFGIGIAQLMGWSARPSSGRTSAGGRFRSNNDIFDEDALQRFAQL